MMRIYYRCSLMFIKNNLVKCCSNSSCFIATRKFTAIKISYEPQQLGLLTVNEGRLLDRYLMPFCIAARGLKNRSSDNSDGNEPDKLSRLFVPLNYKNDSEESIGEEIVGPLKREEILSIVHRFYSDEEVKALALEQGLDQYLYQQTIISFRKLCFDPKSIPTELHIVINDILKGASHIHDLYPFFFKHARTIFPHLNCLDELYRVSDLTQPPNWYPEARALKRKIIFHAGPTNSGKTYHAMEHFLSSKSGVYCSPLKLLAVEVHQKSNDHGTPCDLITGEERKCAVSEEFPANHVACTVEMTSTTIPYDIGIIDEIQMIRDPTRGWAWTRAFFGLCSKEIHICGEGSAIDLIKELAMSVGEDVEVRRYKRLTKLTVEETALVSLDMVRPGDCIVCFSKQQIHQVAQAIERMGNEVAVIYGGLPPGVKLAQARKFNDPNHPCKIMVATDAIGMGLNLSIRRIIFNTLVKPNTNENGEMEMDTISISQALQISGRAGRFGTPYEEGFVTTLKASDLPILQKILSQSPQIIEQAGINPTADQIELFAFHLPNYTLSNLVEIFIKLSTVDSSLYFMCGMDDFKFLADLIHHIPMNLKAQYTFCCAPINRKMKFVCAMFLKFARQYSLYEVVTMQWLCQQVQWPFSPPKNINELVHLEEVFDVFDLYLWLSYRFKEMFPDTDMVRSLQLELDGVIHEGVTNITQLLRNTDESSYSSEENSEKLAKKVLKNLIRNPNKPLGTQGSLTDRLLRQGILSPKMLEGLQEEWKLQEKNSENTFKNIKEYGTKEEWKTKRANTAKEERQNLWQNAVQTERNRQRETFDSEKNGLHQENKNKKHQRAHLRKRKHKY